jgi:hypothetical protein
MAMKYTKCPLNRPNVHKIYQHLLLQFPPQFTQIYIFGLKINHLATLPPFRQLARQSVVFRTPCVFNLIIPKIFDQLNIAAARRRFFSDEL